MIRNTSNKLQPFGIRGTLCSVFRRMAIVGLGAFMNSVIKLNIKPEKYEKEYDLAVIGGGSGGLATAFQASKQGLSVIVIDYVEESPHHTKWGLGGTCVNVGCIPKKLMHQAAKGGQNIIDANEYGWVLPNQTNQRQNHSELMKTFQWQKIRQRIQNHIKSLNFGYIAKINKQDLQYLNCLATFKDKNTLICSKSVDLIKNYIQKEQLPQNRPQKKQIFYQEIKAKNFVIATGTRPSYLTFEGSELAITSDDVFSLKKAPGKTLIVGGGYVAVEIAGFLNGMGFNTTLMTRGEYLRSFDRDMVKVIIDDLAQRKVNIVPTSLPVSLKKVNQSQIQAQLQNQKTKAKSTDIFDTVLFAVGRYATTDLLNLDKIGVKRSTKNKKIVSSQEEVQKTNIENIYALGDVVDGLPELTSTAVKMGQHLGRRLAHRMGKKEFKNHQMFVSLQNFPTTIFTPLEYSTCGLSEQQAKKKYGSQQILTYHIKYTPLQESILDKYTDEGKDYKSKVYAKAIVQKATDKVVGLHYAGPHSGQIMQGFAVAINLGLTKQALDSTIGIHPTIAEDLTNMTVTKESGEEYEKTSC